MASWQEIIAAVAADHDSGSWAIAGHAADALVQAAGDGESALRTAIQHLIAAQPSMAAVRNLCNAAAWAAARGQDPGTTARAFIQDGDTNIQALARQTATLLQDVQRAVTISASSAVAAALAAWPGPVLVLESRPRCEGHTLAEQLARQGRSVALAVDAAGRRLLEPGDVILLGADSVTMAGLTNKIGSWLLAAGARERGLPCYGLASREKWWPAPLPEPGGSDRDPREVLPRPLPGVTVHDPYFEQLPFDLVTAVVGADGLYSAGEVAGALAAWQVHPWLLGRA